MRGVSPMSGLLCFLILLFCAACGGGGSGGSTDTTGPSEPLRWADGNYEIGDLGDFQIVYFAWDAVADDYEKVIITLDTLSVDIVDGAVGGSSSVLEVVAGSETVNSGSPGPLDGIDYDEAVTISGKIDGYVWQLQFNFADGAVCAGRYGPYDGEGTLSADLLEGGSIAGSTWRDGDVNLSGAVHGGISVARIGAAASTPGSKSVPLPSGSGVWLKDGAWEDDSTQVHMYIPAVDAGGDTRWGGYYDTVQFDMNLEIVSGVISGTATVDYLSLDSDSSAIPTSVIAEGDVFDFSGTVSGAWLRGTMTSQSKDLEFSFFLAPNRINTTDGDTITDIEFGYGVVSASRIWPPGEMDMDVYRTGVLTEVAPLVAN